MAEVEFAHRYERALAGTQFLQLITRTFSNLRLTAHQEIADTISAMTGSFLDCRARAALLCDGSGQLAIAASEGFGDPAQLTGEGCRALWHWVMDEKRALSLGPEQVLARWPAAPPAACKGLACVAIDLHDRSIGVLAVADRRSRAPFAEDELVFLSCASGLASMAVANADAHAEQRQQRKLAEDRAAQAAAEAREKQAALTELDRKLQIIERQQLQIAKLSTPVLQVHPQILALPLIGILDDRRQDELTARLMEHIAHRHARYVILDVTGIEAVDTATAGLFLRLARTTRLLGATCILTGIGPAMARTIVALGVELDSLTTRASFGDGLNECLARLGKG